MFMLRPQTFLNLLIIGFIVVSLPLTVGIISTLSYLNRLTVKSVEIVEHTMGGVKDSQELSEYLLNEERHIRMFEVVSSQKQLAKAMKWHMRSAALLENLKKLPLEGTVRKNILIMESMLQSVNNKLILLQKEPSSQKLTLVRLLTQFKTVQDRGDLIGRDMSVWVETEIGKVKQFVKKARRMLIYQAIGFVAFTILMIAVFVILISRPINQLNSSVERLGMGDFTSPITVVGPKDIEVVGEKLEWLRKRLAFLEQEKKKFLAHISHELKTPLASIREGAGLLSEEVVGTLDDKQRQVASILVNNSIKLQQLIDNMLKINMAQAGRTGTKREVIRLNRLIDKVASEHANAILSKKLTLELQLLEVTIFGYRKQLEDIFENLFSNAVKFSPIGGAVGCTMKLLDKKVSLLIYDEGPGIPVDAVEKVFDSYYKVKGHVYDNREGSGLGLAIAKEYVESRGGTLEVVKDGKPGGRFRVMLPLEQRERENEDQPLSTEDDHA